MEGGDCLRSVSRLLAVTAHDLDFVGYHSLARILHLESDIFYQEGPDLVAETVGVEMTLHDISCALLQPAEFRVP